MGEVDGGAKASRSSRAKIKPILEESKAGIDVPNRQWLWLYVRGLLSTICATAGCATTLPTTGR